MSKKVLILSASPRRGGNSDLLCNEFMHGAVDAGNTVEKLFIADSTIHYCTGCGVCSSDATNKSCPQKDDMASILQKMIEADVIVMATPVYFYSMNAQLKVLIDRACARYTEINNKEFYLIMTAAENDQDSMSPVVEGFRGFTSCLNNAVEKEIIYGLGVWHVGDINGKPIVKHAYESGKNV